MLPTNTTFNQITMFIAFIILALALTATSTIVQFENQDEYEGFLDLIDRDVKERTGELNTSRDRHQRQYITCQEKNATEKTGRNVRCYKESSIIPACFATYDSVHNELIQGCYGYQKDMVPMCEAKDDCPIEVLKKRFGFCCCTGHQCNMEKKMTHDNNNLEHFIGNYKFGPF